MKLRNKKKSGFCEIKKSGFCEMSQLPETVRNSLDCSHILFIGDKISKKIWILRNELNVNIKQRYTCDVVERK